MMGCCALPQLIFRGSSLKSNASAAPIPRHKRKGPKIYLNCCGAWAITFDRIKASSFHVTWTPDSVSVDYQEAGGLSDSRQFSPERLRQLDLHIRFRRSSGTGQTASLRYTADRAAYRPTWRSLDSRKP
jgi:hypothetical protein